MLPMGRKKEILSVILFLVLFCLITFLFLRLSRWEDQKCEQEIDSLVKSVYFEGMVIDAPVYKQSTLLCVKIDASSVDSFYYFSRGCCGVIVRDSIAVFSIGLIDENNPSDLFMSHAERVVVNKDYDTKTLFIRNGDTLVYNIYFGAGRIDEVHLLMAWENARDTVRREQHP